MPWQVPMVASFFSKAVFVSLKLYYKRTLHGCLSAEDTRFFRTAFLQNTCESVDNNPGDIYLFEVNSGNTGIACEIYLKLTITTLEYCHWYRFGVFIINFVKFLEIVIAFPILTLNMWIPARKDRTELLKQRDNV